MTILGSSHRSFRSFLIGDILYISFCHRLYEFTPSDNDELKPIQKKLPSICYNRYISQIYAVSSIIIRPKSGWFDLHLSDLWRYHDLAMLFVWRDFVAQYKQTYLSYLNFRKFVHRFVPEKTPYHIICVKIMTCSRNLQLTYA